MNGADSALLVTISAALLVITGLKKQPGIGVIGALILITLTLWLRGEGVASLGFGRPEDWRSMVLLGLGLGVGIQLLTVVLLEPLSERLTGERHDHSIVAGVKGSWKALLQWLVVVWVLVAFLEELVYRGFLMTEIAGIVGTSAWGLALNVAFTSVVFGLSHGYQGRSGILSTGVVGALLGLVYIWSDFNLWLPIFVHGFIDTVGIGLIAVGADQAIRRRIWGEDQAQPETPV